MCPKRSILCVAAAFVSMGIAACSPGGSTSSSPRVMSAQVATSPPKQAAQTKSTDDDDDGAAGVLVVSADLVHRCANLQALKNHPPRDEGKAWLVILKSIAECMNSPEHRNDRLLLTGGRRPDAVIRFVLAKMGVSEDRVDTLESASADDDCPSDDECTTFAVRIDVAPPRDDKQRF